MTPTHSIVNPDELQSRIASGNLKNLTINGEVNLTAEYLTKKTSFTECTFTNSLRIEDFTSGVYLKFERCIFNSTVYLNISELSEGIFITDCTFEEKFVMRNFSRGDITLENCVYHDVVNLHNCAFETLKIDHTKMTDLTISGKVNTNDHIGSIIITGLNAELIEVAHAILNSNVTIENCVAWTFMIRASTIIGDVLLHGDKLYLNDFELQDATVKGAVVIEKGTSVKLIELNRSTLEGPFIVKSEENLETVWLQDSVFEVTVETLLPELFKSFYIENCDFKVNLNCSSNEQRGSERIKPLFKLQLMGILRGNVTFIGLSIATIEIMCTNLGTIEFRDVSVKDISLCELKNHGYITFADLVFKEPASSFNILNANIDKTEFINVDLGKFREVSILRSEVSNIILANSALPRDIKLFSSFSTENYEISLQEITPPDAFHRENYRQLKVAMERQGNRSAALHYKSLEMHHLRLESEWGSDKALLYLNYLSNNHGLSWSRGIVFTLLTATLLYVAFEFTLDHAAFNLDDYLLFLSAFPLYKVQTELSGAWTTSLVILLSRIIIGYGIYQTISAFRKFATK